MDSLNIEELSPLTKLSANPKTTNQLSMEMFAHSLEVTTLHLSFRQTERREAQGTKPNQGLLNLRVAKPAAAHFSVAEACCQEALGDWPVTDASPNLG